MVLTLGGQKIKIFWPDQFFSKYI